MFDDLPPEKLQVMLTEAKDALHLLLIGKAVANVYVRDKRIEYTQTTIHGLVDYITALEAALGKPRPLYKVAKFDV